MRKLVLLAAVLIHPLCYGITFSKERVVMHTDLGTLVLKLYPEVAPKTVAQFLKMARLGIYDTTNFFRVHPGFVAQVSDAAGREVPLSPIQQKVIEKIPGEFSSLRHQLGTLSMARWESDVNSAQMSFSILLGDAPHLDGKYAIFGEVESGHEVLKALQEIPRREYAPLERIRINRVIVADNAEELKSIVAMRIPRREIASAPSRSPAFLIGALIWMAVVSAACGFFGSKFGPRTVLGMHFAQFLVALFTLIVVLGPEARSSSWIGGFILLSMLAGFRLFGKFESA